MTDTGTAASRSAAGSCRAPTTAQASAAEATASTRSTGRWDGSSPAAARGAPARRHRRAAPSGWPGPSAVRRATGAPPRSSGPPRHEQVAVLERGGGGLDPGRWQADVAVAALGRHPAAGGPGVRFVGLPHPTLRGGAQALGGAVVEDLPSRITRTRWHSAATSLVLCVDSTTVPRRAVSESSDRSSMRCSGSRPGGGLVQYQQLGVAEQSRGEGDALAHAARQRADLPVPHVPEADRPPARAVASRRRAAASVCSLSTAT